MIVLKYLGCILISLIYWVLAIAIFPASSGWRILIWLIPGLVGAYTASKRRKNPYGWAIIGLVFSLGFALGPIILLQEERKCPYCGKLNLADKKFCGSCGKELL
jgi:hypothetical protein